MKIYIVICNQCHGYVVESFYTLQNAQEAKIKHQKNNNHIHFCYCDIVESELV